jgi:hypothetical protein
MNDEYFMCCAICGYETEDKKDEFHRMDVDRLSEEGHRIYIDICDICHNIHGAYSKYHATVETPITFLTFVQGLHYINKQIKGNK